MDSNKFLILLLIPTICIAKLASLNMLKRQFIMLVKDPHSWLPYKNKKPWANPPNEWWWNKHSWVNPNPWKNPNPWHPK